MRMNWYRMYHDARNDAKLRTLSDGQFRVWFNLLCLASEQAERGTIEEYDHDLLSIEVANGDDELLASTLKQLQRLHIVDVTPCNAPVTPLVEGARVTAVTVVFTHFAERQYDKPSDRPDRVKQRVDRHREAHNHAQNDVVTPCNAPVTPCNAQIREEKIRVEESKDVGAADAAAGEQGEEAKPKRKARIPKDFGLTDRMIEWAKSKGFDEVLDLERETEEFTNYWRGRGDPMLDWVATWRSRITQRAGIVGSMAGGRNARSIGRGLSGSNRAGNSGERQPDPEGFNIERYSNIAS